MSRAKTGKKKSRINKSARPYTPKATLPGELVVTTPGPVAGEGTSPGDEITAPKLSRPVAAAAAKVEPEEKAYYGETASAMLKRVRGELLKIVVLAAASFGVGLLAVQFIKL